MTRFTELQMTVIISPLCLWWQIAKEKKHSTKTRNFSQNLCYFWATVGNKGGPVSNLLSASYKWLCWDSFVLLDMMYVANNKLSYFLNIYLLPS